MAVSTGMATSVVDASVHLAAPSPPINLPGNNRCRLAHVYGHGGRSSNEDPMNSGHGSQDVEVAPEHIAGVPVPRCPIRGDGVF